MTESNKANGTSPALKWGILGTGWVSTMFTKDLVVARSDASAHHEIVAIGTSASEKGHKFVTDVVRPSPGREVRVYDSYQGVYDDPAVDIVYVGTPHSSHMQNCLDAIAAGKHVLCEKPFAINAREANMVVEAARKKNVFVMEAVWTRFFPLVAKLQQHLHTLQTIGRINRVFADFGLSISPRSRPASSRLTDPKMGAGALLDIGIYSLMWASIVFGAGLLGKDHPAHKVTSACGLLGGIDESNVIILDYPDDEGSRMAICTSTLLNKSGEDFCRIEGSKGIITIFGPASSCPDGFRISLSESGEQKAREEIVTVPKEGLGFCFEADAVAKDIFAGRTENKIMPLDETLRMMELLDRIRKSGGVVYPQDNV